jgi:hypothetical protein
MDPPFLYHSSGDGVTGMRAFCHPPAIAPLALAALLTFGVHAPVSAAGEKALMKAAMDGNLGRLKGTPFSSSPASFSPLRVSIGPVPVYYCDAA